MARKLLFDARLADLLAASLDVLRDMERLDPPELTDAVVLAP